MKMLETTTKKERKMTGKGKESIPGAGKWGGTNTRVQIVGVGIRSHFEYRDEAWWKEFRSLMGQKGT